MRKVVNLFVCILCGTLLTGCWKETVPRTFVRPVKVVDVQSLASYDKEYVGVVSAEQYTNYAFRVGGLINKTYVTEGTFVKKGQLMAELDPGDFLLQLSADKSQFETTKSILERNKRLLDKQAISKQDYEIAASNYQQAKSQYAYSQNQLEYTKLRAPFSGSVEKKFVENYQKVNPGEPIYKIINPDILEVKFVLPENDVRVTELKKTGSYFVEFDNYRNEFFTARIKEVVDASVDGAGIPITLAITDEGFNPDKYNIKAGFACRIKIRIENDSVRSNYCTVPVTAIFSHENDQTTKYVWIYDPASSIVRQRAIVTSGLIGSDRVIVKEGVKMGEKVVTAGVYQIVDNQKVNLL